MRGPRRAAAGCVRLCCSRRRVRCISSHPPTRLHGDHNRGGCAWKEQQSGCRAGLGARLPGSGTEPCGLGPLPCLVRLGLRVRNMGLIVVPTPGADRGEGCCVQPGDSVCCRVMLNKLSYFFPHSSDSVFLQSESKCLARDWKTGLVHRALASPSLAVFWEAVTPAPCLGDHTSTLRTSKVPRLAAQDLNPDLSASAPRLQAALSLGCGWLVWGAGPWNQVGKGVAWPGPSSPYGPRGHNCSVSVTSTQHPATQSASLLMVPAQASAPNYCAVKAVPGALTGSHLFPGRRPCWCTCRTAALAQPENAWWHFLSWLRNVSEHQTYLRLLPLAGCEPPGGLLSGS